MNPDPQPISETPQHAALGSRLVYCRVCLGEHDDEIHAATLSVRLWFRDEVTRSFQPRPVLDAIA